VDDGFFPLLADSDFKKQSTKAKKVTWTPSKTSPIEI
jgi:hypothetical protein